MRRPPNFPKPPISAAKVAVAVELVERIERRDVVARDRAPRVARDVDAFPRRETPEEIALQRGIVLLERLDERADLVRPLASCARAQVDHAALEFFEPLLALDDDVHCAANSGTALSGAIARPSAR